MTIRKGDRRLKEFVDAAVPRVAALAVTGDMATVRDLVVGLLKKTSASMAKVIDEARVQTVEEAQADTLLQAAEVEAVECYDAVYTNLRIGHLYAKLDGTATDSSHSNQLKLFLEGNNPSDFETATVDAKLGYMKRALTFRAEFLDPHADPALITRFEAARDNLDAAHTHWATELEETAEMQAKLNAFISESRVTYRICRDWTNGCLRSLGREGELARIIRPLRDIYGSNSKAKSQTDAPADAAPVDPTVIDEPV